MSRAELLIPDGWKPAPGMRVQILTSKDRPLPPAGTWRIIDRGPSTNGWWLMPANEPARQWASKWPNEMVQGCLEVVGRLLAPPTL